MSRINWAISTSAILIFLAAVVFWLLWTNGDSSVSESADGQIAQEGALTPDMQTPVYVPPAETLDDAEDVEADAAATQTAVLLPSKYQFQSAEDALNYYAKMVGNEAERLKNDPSFTPPEPEYKEDGSMLYNDEHVSWEDAWYGGVATSIIHRRIFEDVEDPEMRQALLPYINEWVPHDWSPPHLMVRAGKWPSAVLRNDVTLPNGQVIDLNTMIGKRVVVKYRMRSKPLDMTDEGRQFLSPYIKRGEEIQTLLASGSVSATESAALQKELTDIQTGLAESSEPQYTEYTRSYGQFMGDETHIEEVVFDLGVIDEDLSAK